jgi:hypothetical protein
VKVALALVSLCLAAAAAASTAGAATSPCAGKGAKRVGAYTVLLRVGPAEEMLTPAQAKAAKSMHGEVMVGGSMSSDGMGMAMPMNDAMRHVEAHVCGSNGKPAHVMPVILVDGKAIPVMAMEGVGMGAGDLHYGNNVTLMKGMASTVVVKVGGRSATFKVM